MRFLFAMLCLSSLALTSDAMVHPETSRLRCINTTDQTIAIFDAHGSQIFIAPHMLTSVTLYTPGIVAWMVTTAPQQIIYETRLRKDTNRLVFSQPRDYASQVICTPELNLINWLCMRAHLGVRNFTSGLSFGTIPAETDEPVYYEDQSFCKSCFCAGLTTSALVTAITAYKLSRLFS